MRIITRHVFLNDFFSSKYMSGNAFICKNMHEIVAVKSSGLHRYTGENACDDGSRFVQVQYDSCIRTPVTFLAHSRVCNASHTIVCTYYYGTLTHAQVTANPNDSGTLVSYPTGPILLLPLYVFCTMKGHRNQ